MASQTSAHRMSPLHNSICAVGCSALSVHEVTWLGCSISPSNTRPAGGCFASPVRTGFMKQSAIHCAMCQWSYSRKGTLLVRQHLLFKLSGTLSLEFRGGAPEKRQNSGTCPGLPACIHAWVASMQALLLAPVHDPHWPAISGHLTLTLLSLQPSWTCTASIGQKELRVCYS